MGPRSRMAVPPEPAYRAGPRSRLQTLNPSMNFDQAPPLPPAPAETPAPAYRPGPRSRMENPPEPAYRAGPRSRLQILNPTLLSVPPPPPPPPEPGAPGGPPSQKNQNITEDDISSFMNQWLEQPPSSTGAMGSNPTPSTQPGVPKIIDYAAPAGAPAPLPSNQGEPVYSSAMAKIRAKRAAKAAEQARQNQPANQPAANYNSYENQNQTTSGFVVDPFNRPRGPEKNRENVARGMIEREFNGRSFDNWNRVHARYWKSYMEEMFNELWVSII